MDNSPKNQKEYYHNKIRDYEKRTGTSLNLKGVNKFYDYNIEETVYNIPAAVDMLLKHQCYIYQEDFVEEDPHSNGTAWLKYGYALRDGKIHKYYYEVKRWGFEAKNFSILAFEDKIWKAGKLKNKHIGSDFDDFAKDNNIVLKRDINWAVKMLDAGKMMTREGNPSLTLFPKKYDHAESIITTTDLFAEDWQIVQPKTFNDVLDDLNAGKTIRRKSWPSDWGVGKYARYGKIIYNDLIADDWEVEDVVAEVNKQQEQILKDRNEH